MENIYNPKKLKYLTPFKERTDRILALSQEQTRQRFDSLASQCSDNDEAMEEMLALFVLKSPDPASYFKAYFANPDPSSFHRTQFFYNAPDDVASELARLAESGVYGQDWSLAQTGGAEALRFFQRRAAGAESGNSEERLREAGRELDGGAFRMLFHDECVPIVFDAGPDNPLHVAKPAGESCACGCQLIDFLTMDLDDPHLAFFGGKGTLRIRFCYSCLTTNYFELYFRVGGDGSCVPYKDLEREPGMEFSDEEMADFAANTLGMAASRIHPVYAHATGYINDSFGLSAVGGMPAWIQSAEHLSCPQCGKTMTFIAQLANSAIMDGELAVMYFHLCGACGIAGVNIQQT